MPSKLIHLSGNLHLNGPFTESLQAVRRAVRALI